MPLSPQYWGTTIALLAEGPEHRTAHFAALQKHRSALITTAYVAYGDDAERRIAYHVDFKETWRTLPVAAVATEHLDL